MSGRPHYSDQQRADVCAMLEAQGYPEKRGALSQVAAFYGIPKRTISRWYNREKNPPPDNLRAESRRALDAKLEDLAHVLIEEANLPAVREEASLSQLMTAFGITVDKMRLLRDLPTSIIGATPELVKLAELLEARNMQPVDVFRNIIGRLEDPNFQH